MFSCLGQVLGQTDSMCKVTFWAPPAWGKNRWLIFWLASWARAVDTGGRRAEQFFSSRPPLCMDPGRLRSQADGATGNHYMPEALS